LCAADLLVYIPGLAWLGGFVGAGKAVSLGFLPFLIGDALKIAAAWSILMGAALVTSRIRDRAA